MVTARLPWPSLVTRVQRVRWVVHQSADSLADEVGHKLGGSVGVSQPRSVTCWQQLQLGVGDRVGGGLGDADTSKRVVVAPDHQCRDGELLQFFALHLERARRNPKGVM